MTTSSRDFFFSASSTWPLGQDVRLAYVAALKDALMKPMLSGGASSSAEGSGGPTGVDATIAMLDEYGLSRDDLFETLAEFKFPDGRPDPFSAVRQPPPLLCLLPASAPSLLMCAWWWRCLLRP